MRYGKDGGKIKVYLSSDGGRIYASVEDNGIGIAQKDLPHIWERFYQADAARSSGGSDWDCRWLRGSYTHTAGRSELKAEKAREAGFPLNFKSRGGRLS